jgi:hypothetical protein
MHINARLDENHSYKLKYLRRITGSGISDLIKQAIDVYYAQVTQTRVNSIEILQAAGFIGCGDASSELSERYKNEFTELLLRKHDYR